MERALAPELIELALGEKNALPSPEELIQLIADAELQLLLGEAEIPEQLQTSAWYLHGIASTRGAQERYGVARQRAAFRVAGHIFDLSLQGSTTDRTIRLRMCFAAQVAFLRSDLNPNALALYRREFAARMPWRSFVTESSETALECGVALLGMDTRYVATRGRTLASEIRDSVDDWGVGAVDDTIFAAAAGVVQGARALAAFLRRGDDTLLEEARALLREAIQNPVSAGDRDSRWVAAHLLDIADGLATSSIWHVLPPNVPTAVRRAFALVHPPVLTLWPPQIEFLQAGAPGEPSPLSPEARRLFVATPTSSGKTLLAQLLIATHLGSGQQGGVCYVAPTRTLCHEVRRALDRRLPYIARRIEADLPEWFSPEEDWVQLTGGRAADVEVMTPERLAFLLRSDTREVLRRFGLFIFDEVHNVGEAGRGWTLESDLALLHHSTIDTHHRIALMSAAVGNRNHFIQWMKADEQLPVRFHSDWRGPRRLHCIWTTSADFAAPEKIPVARGNALPRVHFPVYGQLHVRTAPPDGVRSTRSTSPVGKLVFIERQNGTRERDTKGSTAKYRMLLPLIELLESKGPVLVVEATRADTVRIALAIAEGGRPSVTGIQADEIKNLVALAEARLGTEHPLPRVLRYGVAYHHSSLPVEVRTGIEEAVTEGHLTCLVATTTMTEGVNLPVRSVVIATRGYYGKDGEFIEIIKGSRLVNAIGRAGRAAKETEGIVVLASPGKYDAKGFDQLAPSDTDIHVSSALATEKALEQLARFEQRRAEDEDAVFEAVDGPVADFLAFVWWAVTELEKAGGAVDEDGVERLLTRTLGWVQLDVTQQERWKDAAGAALAVYRNTDSAARRRWATTGTSIPSARILDEIAAEVALVAADGIPEEPIKALAFVLGDGRLERLFSLPECPRRKLYLHRSARRENPIDVPLIDLLSDWVEGVELVDLASRYLHMVPDVDFRFEQLGDFLYDYFEYFLPWALSAVIASANSIMAEPDSIEDQLQIRTDLPAYIRWGVNNRPALALLATGLRSRRLALAVSEAYLRSGAESSVHAWVCQLGIAGWQQEFEASLSDLRDLVDFCRERQDDVASRVLSGTPTRIQVETELADHAPTPAELFERDTPGVHPIEVQVEGQTVGVIPARYQADLQGLLRAGLEIEVLFECVSGQAEVCLTLDDGDVS